MCCLLFQSGEKVKLANGNPTLGTVIVEKEYGVFLHDTVLVTWEDAVLSEYGYLVICKYYKPEELIHA